MDGCGLLIIALLCVIGKQVVQEFHLASKECSRI